MSNLPPEQMTARSVSDDWQVVEDALFNPDPAALPALARLREREAQLERERDHLLSAVGASMDDTKLLAVEARVARLEEALREIGVRGGKGHGMACAQIADAALAHEEEKPKGEVLNPPPNYSSQDQSEQW